MFRGLSIAIVAAVGLAMLPAGDARGASAAESPSTLLERGIYQEQTTGDIDAAIAAYKQIVDDNKANRPIIAQAYLRLGNCYMKKGNNHEAMLTFQTLISVFSDQKDVVTQAKERLEAARGGMSDADIASAVDKAVTTISTCAETDPRLAGAMASLKDLKQEAVVAALVKYLDSSKNTIRRSAIYVLWKGGFDSIAPAVPALMKLCSHEEDMTRGMAALALGGNKVESSFQPLCDMAIGDKSGYARRCAAYALGLLGDQRGQGVLEKVLKDPKAMVRNNAEAAMTMLSKADRSKSVTTATQAPKAPNVIRTNPPAFANDVDASLDKLSVTFDQPMMDGSWSWTGGGETFPKGTGKPYYDQAKTTCTFPVRLEPGKVYWVGINSPSYRNFQTPQGVPAGRYAILFATKTADGSTVDIPAEMLTRAKAINEAARKAQQADAASGAPPQAVKDAKQAATEWLKFIDSGKYEQSWDEMGKMAKSAVTKAQWAKDAAPLSFFGALQSRKLLSAEYATTLPGVPDGQYVTIQYESVFANKQQATETVTVAKEPDGTWRVVGCFVK
ncbi:MAG: DUF4019 domain-containing protein [Phycisphaerae bacterium]|jgi:tetratricopeptide (TPR) repeat protein